MNLHRFDDFGEFWSSSSKKNQLGGIYDFDEFFAIFVTARNFGHIS